MNNKIMRKYGYFEYYVNNSIIRKLYFRHLHNTFFDKMLNVLIHFAIWMTFLTVILEFFFEIPKYISLSLHSFTVLVLFIFGLELFRDFAHSRNKKAFFKHYWVDFILVSFLSFYFFTATYFGLGRFRFFIEIKNYFTELKHIKIVLRALGFNF